MQRGTGRLPPVRQSWNYALPTWPPSGVLARTAPTSPHDAVKRPDLPHPEFPTPPSRHHISLDEARHHLRHMECSTRTRSTSTHRYPSLLALCLTPRRNDLARMAISGSLARGRGEGGGAGGRDKEGDLRRWSGSQPDFQHSASWRDAGGINMHANHTIHAINILARDLSFLSLSRSAVRLCSDGAVRGA